MITLLELRQLIADECDFSKPLQAVAHDIGKKAKKHSTVRMDENYPAMLKITPGKYDDRTAIEFAHYPDCTAIMPEDALAQLDEMLESNPKATVGWVYFFYFPMDYVTVFKQTKRKEHGLLDSSNVKGIYLAEGEPNTLVFEAEYGVGSFD